jgi:general secretion pathway protein G
MNLAHPKKSVRSGFTLVEMLVVIVIIGVIMGLISAAVVKALGTGKQAKNRAEISQLELAVEAFKQKYGVYPPSRIMLAKKRAYYPTNPTDPLYPLANDSIAFLTKVFPRLASPNPLDRNSPWTYAGPSTGADFVDWNGNGLPDQGKLDILEGDQSLVFFVGGIPDHIRTGAPPNCTGFSTNGGNPAYHLRFGGDVNPPLFQFGSDRLVLLRSDGQPIHPRAATSTTVILDPSPSLFFSYLDTYSSSNGQARITDGAPYAYFSSYKTTNGYNRYYESLQTSDCDRLGVWPYAEFMGPNAGSARQPIYLKPDGFQIVSPGPDHTFGIGTEIRGLSPQRLPFGGPAWTKATAATVYSETDADPRRRAGHDDQANFTGSLLGVGVD